MALPLLGIGAAIGATGGAIFKILKPSDPKKELKATTLVVLEPKTFIQRGAANLVQSLFF